MTKLLLIGIPLLGLVFSVALWWPVKAALNPYRGRSVLIWTVALIAGIVVAIR